MLTLTAISIERWLAICRPLMFRQTSVRAKRAIAIVWVVSLASSAPDAVSLDLSPVSAHPRETSLYCGPSWSQDMETIHLWIIFIVFYIVPLCIMTFTYIKVALCLWQSGLMDENDGKLSVCFFVSRLVKITLSRHVFISFSNLLPFGFTDRGRHVYILVQPDIHRF